MPMDDLVLIVKSLKGKTIATVRETKSGEFDISSQNSKATSAIEELIARGRKIGLIYHHDHRQKTNKGVVFRMYGRWSKPGDRDFLEALADALEREFGLFAYVEELVDATPAKA